eukprot:4420134-Alexandrium_andersonii.AAC.1
MKGWKTPTGAGQRRKASESASGSLPDAVSGICQRFPAPFGALQRACLCCLLYTSPSPRD